METTSVTGVVKVLDILPGAKPAILTEEQTRFRGGKRLFTQKVAVLDRDLFQRLCGEVQKGAEIEITITTEWHEENSISYLSAFRSLLIPIPIDESVSTI